MEEINLNEVEKYIKREDTPWGPLYIFQCLKCGKKMMSPYREQILSNALSHMSTHATRAYMKHTTGGGVKK